MVIYYIQGKIFCQMFHTKKETYCCAMSVTFLQLLNETRKELKIHACINATQKPIEKKKKICKRNFIAWNSALFSLDPIISSVVHNTIIKMVPSIVVSLFNMITCTYLCIHLWNYPCSSPRSLQIYFLLKSLVH